MSMAVSFVRMFGEIFVPIFFRCRGYFCEQGKFLANVFRRVMHLRNLSNFLKTKYYKFKKPIKNSKKDQINR